MFESQELIMAGGNAGKSRKIVEAMIVGVLVIVVAAIAVPKDSTAHEPDGHAPHAAEPHGHTVDNQSDCGHH